MRPSWATVATWVPSADQIWPKHSARPAGGRRAVGLVEEPLVGADRPVEPDGVVEARADEVLPQPPPSRAKPGRQQGQVADEGQRRGVHGRVVAAAGRPPGTSAQVLVSGGSSAAR